MFPGTHLRQSFLMKYHFFILQKENQYYILHLRRELKGQFHQSLKQIIAKPLVIVSVLNTALTAVQQVSHLSVA